MEKLDFIYASVDQSTADEVYAWACVCVYANEWRKQNSIQIIYIFYDCQLGHENRR